MNKNVIRIGVLGCANIAKRSVIPAIKELKQKFFLIAVASRTESKAREFALEFDCEAIVGYQELINRIDIDAIYVPLPTGLHLEWISKALLSGKHVYAEKSFALSLSDSSYLVEKARLNNLALMEGYMFIYHSQHKIVKNLIESGEIGEIRTFRSSFGFPPLNQNNFRYQKEIGGGVVFDAAGYPLRAAHFILGNDLIVTGSSLCSINKSGVPHFGNAFLRNNKGLSAQISFGFDNFYQCNYEIWGSCGKITVTKAFTPKSNEGVEIVVEKPQGSNIINVPSDNHFINAFVEFYNVVISGERENSYNDILRQSRSLDTIISLSEKFDT